MKMFSLYKHKNCTDVAIMPLKRYFIPEKNTVKVKVEWYNIASGKPFKLGVSETLEIPIEQYCKDWEEYNEEVS